MLVVNLRRFHYVTLGAFCASAIIGVGAPAFGQEFTGDTNMTAKFEETPGQHLSAPVYSRDLDLTTEAGIATLRRREWKAAEELCNRLGELHIGGQAQVLPCEKDALKRATPSVRAVIAQAQIRAHAAATEEQRATTLGTKTAQVASSAKAAP